MSNSYDLNHYPMNIKHKPIMLIGGIFLLLVGGFKFISTLMSLPSYGGVFQTEYAGMMMALLAVDLLTGASEAATGILSILYRNRLDKGKLCMIVAIIAVILSFITALCIIFLSDGPSAYRGGRMPLDLLVALFIVISSNKLRWLNHHPELWEQAGFAKKDTVEK